MSWRELMDWHRFEAATAPLPDRMTDMHFALLAALVINRTRSADSEPAAMSDFYLIKDPPLSFEDDGLSEAERAAKIWRGG